MSPARKAINERYLPEFARYCRSGEKILFVGVNTKWDYKNLFTIRQCEYFTMDIKEELKPDIVADITSCPEIVDESYDGIILIGMWEYIDDKSKMFNEVYRLLKPGGKLLACVPGEAYYNCRCKYFDMEKDLKMFTGFYIDKICYTYYKNHTPYYYNIFARK